MAILHNTNYDPNYEWRPMYYWDHCPACFEVFDLDSKCDHCGSGHEGYNPHAELPVKTMKE